MIIFAISKHVVMKTKSNKQSISKILFAVSIVFVCMSSCLDEYAPGSYYTFSGNTIASFLENEKNNSFTSFIYVLKRAGLWGEMQTYGSYTCIAPTNSAFESYLRDKAALKGVDSLRLEDLSVEECDTIAKTHLLSELYFTTDMIEGSFPTTNRLDRYLTYSFGSDSLDNNKLIYFINKTARMIERDDTVENGVVHIVDQVVQPSSDFLPDLLKSDPDISIFYAALVKTHLNDSLIYYKDLSYRAPGGDSCVTGVKYHTGNEWEYAIFPENRYIKFTAFVETNQVYAQRGINSLEDLIEYADSVYHESYPNDGTAYDTLWTDRRNPLNRFVSYHLLKFYGGYSDWNVNNESIVSNNYQSAEWDREDFFETLLPHSFVRISTTSSGKSTGVFINRKGTPKNIEFRGVRLLPPSEMADKEQNALNGIYHYIDDILDYGFVTRNQVFNTRLRYDCTTMSPDFVNSGGRNHKPDESDICTGMLDGFTENWSFSKETLLSVRNRHQWFYSYEGDEVILQGIYDATLKLPPVPFSGTYEIRIGYPVMDSRGVIQAYFGDGPEKQNLVPCGIPLDLRVSGPDPKVGWKTDEGYTEEQVRVFDKAMRNRGYMKGALAYGASGAWFRTVNSMLRKILTTQYMDAEGDYYLRVRQLLDNNMAEMVFDYLELVPKSVYASETGEDKW